MTKPAALHQYLQNYAAAAKWRLIAGDTENVSQVIVIPAYAEIEMLFATLASLARNHPSLLADSLVLCVVNNKPGCPATVKKNNHQTMAYLHELVNKSGCAGLHPDENMKSYLHLIRSSRLRLGYIDASTPGYEIPEKDGGVGTARKIGMDMALRLFSPEVSLKKLIISLDADTLVPVNYLAAIKNRFTSDIKTAVIAYEHQEPMEERAKEGIYCYEIFLRYWLLGLQYAKSPYAFHSIGSALVCSADAYLAVRGMNRRAAGEDFYFLNKLAKLGRIEYIRETHVYPSARVSRRVPFGTGKRMQQFLAGEQKEYILYDPQIFKILAKWLLLMEKSLDSGESEILKKASSIHPLLFSFLTACGFGRAWTSLRRNIKDEEALIRHFHCWFDGFRTLKLINYLTRQAYPPQNMFGALREILAVQKIAVPEFIPAGGHADLARQKLIVQYLRALT
ncbi:MAG TPA: glycosyltransferase family 2 protein [Smithellaceae bacterium]|nr:glycosyltransferase family 2 protein [Smithellaceae bacterium]